MCQLTGHVEYLVPHSMCPLIYMGSMETIKEQASTFEGGSLEELAPNEQGPCPGAARHQRARAYPRGGEQDPRGCLPSASTPRPLGVLAPACSPSDIAVPRGVAHPWRVGLHPGATCLRRPWPWSTSPPPPWIRPASFFYMHPPLCTSPLNWTSTSEFLPH